ncbi:hypothetical protein QA640_11685 [Bradyrhizobium sp. CB82]|uniref:hypothetical protein n=1 Tax=Bradyrhizobium sp. CB82 TaxID=3039159 RepID=UPI0024B0A1C6|nr:hypothetical protein [Bradyrhizobium sp. CB82]WFU43048.1 hypothetical protein QA640_11685 [Bradyrhizobium sp. CB82]
MKARLSASPFETRGKSALLRVRVYQFFSIARRPAFLAMTEKHAGVIARLDRAIQYAAAYPFNRTASGILDPRFRGDDSVYCVSRSDANELS